MLKSACAFLLLAIPTLAAARIDTPRHTVLLTTAELAGLAHMDPAPRAAIPHLVRGGRMQDEVAALRDQVGRMKLDRLIETVLTEPRPARLYR